MKTKIIFITAIILLGGCYRWNPTGPYTLPYQALKAVTITKDSLRHSIQPQPARDLHNAGKIYIYKNYLFVAEPLVGIHIYDDANPSNPSNIGFIAVPGCNDMAVKDNTLYVDNAIDLVAIDITDPHSPKLTSRIQDVFPDLPAPVSVNYYYIVSNPDPTNLVTISWKDTTINR